MSKRFKLIILTLAVVGMLAGALAAYGSVSARSNAAVSDTAPVMDYLDVSGELVMNPQQRGTSDLVRTVDGIAMNFDSTDMPIGGWTFWWIIFNNPSACSDGDCGINDLLPPGVNPDAEASAGWATGGIVGADRMGHFSARLGVGADAFLGQVLLGDGLSNPMGAAIHVIAKYHGPASFGDPAALGLELTTTTGSCKSAEDLGGFPCYDAQVTVHDR